MEHGPHTRSDHVPGAFLGKLDELKRVIRAVAVEHLPGHSGKDVGTEHRVGTRVRGSQGQAVVLLRPSVETAVPCHGRRRSGELRHDPVEARLHLGHLVLVQGAGDLGKLP
ncbi:hypothetical protein ACIOG4_04420 [Streptomyces microflavus]|uniref:hypothetical protein n=1 Tax=Streptomyces microflavus TaxID=1919 RepID=UPI00381074BA